MRRIRAIVLDGALELSGRTQALLLLLAFACGVLLLIAVDPFNDF